MIYLDNAATTWPKPEEVYTTMDKFFREYGANPGRAGHKMAAQAGRVIYEVREKVADFFGAKDSSEIIFTSNATQAINMGLLGVIQEGDHIITSCLEHNSVIRPLKELEREGLISLTIIGLDPIGDLDYNDLESKIRKETKMIIVTHGSNVTGHIFDIMNISKIAKKHGILLMVDVAQTAGFLDINVNKIGIDMMAFPGHKSLYGPPGTGGLYIKSGIPVKAIFSGGTGSKSEDLYQPEIWPDKFESGTGNSIGVAGLGAGIDFINREGFEAIREHEMLLTAKLIDGLGAIKNVKIYGPTKDKIRTPVVSFNIGFESSSEVGYILDQAFDIAVRSGIHCAPLAHQTLGTLEQGLVRASIGYFTTLADIEFTLNAINLIAKQVG